MKIAEIFNECWDVGYRSGGGERLRRLEHHGLSGNDDHEHRKSEHIKSASVQHSDSDQRA